MEQKRRVLDAIESINGKFAVHSSLQLNFPPDLWISDIGIVGLPLCEDQAQRIFRRMRVPGLNVEFKTPEWATFLAAIATTAAGKLGVRSQVQAHLETMTLFSKDEQHVAAIE